MTKKQSLVAWITGILIILRIVFPSGRIKGYHFGQMILILIVGVVLIYILRDKNKPKEKTKEKPRMIFRQRKDFRGRNT